MIKKVSFLLARWFSFQSTERCIYVLLMLMFLASCGPKQPIELRQVKEVVADATTNPTLKAEAIFYNPNNLRMRLKKINIEIFVNGKKVGDVDQDMKIVIPAKQEFTIPIEVKLAIKDFGFLDTVLGMLGGKKMQIHYKGHLRLSYHGLPIRVPVDHEDEVKISF